MKLRVCNSDLSSNIDSKEILSQQSLRLKSFLTISDHFSKFFQKFMWLLHVNAIGQEYFSFCKSLEPMIQIQTGPFPKSYWTTILIHSLVHSFMHSKRLKQFIYFSHNSIIDRSICQILLLTIILTLNHSSVQIEIEEKNSRFQNLWQNTWCSIDNSMYFINRLRFLASLTYQISLCFSNPHFVSFCLIIKCAKLGSSSDRFYWITAIFEITESITKRSESANLPTFKADSISDDLLGTGRGSIVASGWVLKNVTARLSGSL
jgi:hypothetical protein